MIRPDEQRLVDGIELLKRTEGAMHGGHVVGELAAAHEEYLTAQAVDVQLARSLGVRSLVSPEDTKGLGGVWENWANFPAILFPWTDDLGERVEYQIRPDDPTEDGRGRTRKYVFRKGMEPVLWAVRSAPEADRMLIVEGTKQCLAAASYAPEGWAVYGMAGCRMWQVDGRPIPDLALADGCTVVVILDADASSNPDVYQAGTGLAEALAMEGATKISFTRLPGDDAKAGLDDVLAGRAPERRAAYFSRILAGAKPKPADSKPKPRRRGSEAPTGKDGRTTVVCNRDRLSVINDLTSALISRWDGKELFNHGGVISRLTATGMSPVDRGTFHDVIQETAVTVNENSDAQGGVTYSFTWPDPGTIAAVTSRSAKFSPLERVAHAPFVRPDGTIVTEPGYDEATKTILLADPVLEGLTVPENPSPEEITAARELILSEWFGDMPFETDADRANLLALIVTPAIRGMVPKVPLAVVDGLQAGVGKNLIADSIISVYTGSAAEPMNWVSEPEELRKQITSAFRTGKEFFVFDEAHTIEGAPLAQALTAETWQDRILGVSTMANFPNRVTWISLGNQVQVRGDLTRRVYRISIRPDYANPQDRPSSSFRHPGISGLDLVSWSRANRRQLMVAILTLVRAWFAQGAPRPRRSISFGSFEVWERIVSGIVEAAGLDGFLKNLKIWRSESDFDTQYWHGHLGWLREQFSNNTFRASDVKGKALADPAAYMAPPKLDDPSEKGYTKALGEAYSRLKGRRYDGMWIERVGSAFGHVSQWRVFEEDDLPPAPGAEPEPAPGPSDPEPDAPTSVDPQPVDYGPRAEPKMHPDGYALTYAPDGPEPDTSASTADVVTFDLETGDAADLYRTPGSEYVRIGGTARGDDPVVSYTHDRTAEYVARRLQNAGTITGHNIMAFDLPALVRARKITMEQIHHDAADGKLFDALVVARFLDPPMARDKGVDADRKYDLGTLAEKYGLGAKLTDVSKRLAKKYGGWWHIPIDDSEDGRAFKDYMVQDVELSRRLYSKLLEELGGSLPEYLVREHRVAALAAQISINGFLVDQGLLAVRMNGIRDRKARAMESLVEHCAIPTEDAKGKAYLSPLSTKPGKAALEKALRAAGATSIWTTPSSGEIQVSADHMLHLGQEYHHLPAVCAIVKEVYRIVSARTVYETIANSMAPDGRVHPRVSFKQATGRWSLTDPGLTVMGKRNGRHVERAVLLPDPGEVLISVDLSQVDMRAVAGLSQDQAYIAMLHEEDPHAELALALFGDRSFREVAKPIGHGWNYGESLRRIGMENDIEPALVRRFDASMRERFPRLVEWQQEVRVLAESGQLLDNGFGRMMRPDPRRAHTQGPALMGQGAARDLMMEGMLRLPAEVLPMLRAQVHDEIVLSVPEEDAVDVGRAVVEALSFEWRGVPILADVSPAGTDWSRCYEK